MFKIWNQKLSSSDMCFTLSQQLDINLTSDEIDDWISTDADDFRHQLLGEDGIIKASRAGSKWRMLN